MSRGVEAPQGQGMIRTYEAIALRGSSTRKVNRAGPRLQTSEAGLDQQLQLLIEP
jgi:hypothetical protein